MYSDKKVVRGGKAKIQLIVKRNKTDTSWALEGNELKRSIFPRFYQHSHPQKCLSLKSQTLVLFSKHLSQNKPMIPFLLRDVTPTLPQLLLRFYSLSRSAQVVFWEVLLHNHDSPLELFILRQSLINGGFLSIHAPSIPPRQ